MSLSLWKERERASVLAETDLRTGLRSLGSVVVVPFEPLPTEPPGLARSRGGGMLPVSEIPSAVDTWDADFRWDITVKLVAG